MAVKILKILYVLILIAGLVLAFMFGFSAGGGVDGDPVIEIGKVGFEPDYTTQGYENYKADVEALGIEDAITTSDYDTKMYTAYDLYRFACRTWWNVPYRGARFLGDGFGGVEGIVEGNLKAFNERYYVKADNPSNPYCYYGYEGKYNLVIDASPSLLKNAADSALAYARQYAFMPAGDWYWQGSQGTLNTEGASGTYNAKDLKFTNANEVKKAVNKDYANDLAYDYINNPFGDPVGGDVPDKTTVFLPDFEGVIPNTLKLSKKALDQGNVYVIDLEIDATTDKNTKYAASSIQKSVSSISNLKYKKLSLSIEIWESGYFRSWSAVERWEGKHNLGTGFVEMASTEVYTYDKEEVVSIIKDRVADIIKNDGKNGSNMLSAIKYNGVAVFK